MVLVLIGWENTAKELKVKISTNVDFLSVEIEIEIDPFPSLHLILEYPFDLVCLRISNCLVDNLKTETKEAVSSLIVKGRDRNA